MVLHKLQAPVSKYNIFYGGYSLSSLYFLEVPFEGDLVVFPYLTLVYWKLELG